MIEEPQTTEMNLFVVRSFLFKMPKEFKGRKEAKRMQKHFLICEF